MMDGGGHLPPQITIVKNNGAECRFFGTQKFIKKEGNKNGNGEQGKRRCIGYRLL